MDAQVVIKEVKSIAKQAILDYLKEFEEAKLNSKEVLISLSLLDDNVKIDVIIRGKIVYEGIGLPQLMGICSTLDAMKNPMKATRATIYEMKAMPFLKDQLEYYSEKLQIKDIHLMFYLQSPQEEVALLLYNGEKLVRQITIKEILTEIETRKEQNE